MERIIEIKMIRLKMLVKPIKHTVYMVNLSSNLWQINKKDTKVIKNNKTNIISVNKTKNIKIVYLTSNNRIYLIKRKF